MDSTFKLWSSICLLYWPFSAFFILGRYFCTLSLQEDWVQILTSVFPSNFVRYLIYKCWHRVRFCIQLQVMNFKEFLDPRWLYSRSKPVRHRISITISYSWRISIWLHWIYHYTLIFLLQFYFSNFSNLRRNCFILLLFKCLFFSALILRKKLVGFVERVRGLKSYLGASCSWWSEVTVCKIFKNWD